MATIAPITTTSPNNLPQQDMSLRKSNFELLRIVAMLLVMLVHANYLSLGAVTQSEVIATPGTGFTRIFTEQICIVSVNLFVLLSGWFGIRPSFKKLASLLFQVMFIGLVTVTCCKIAGYDTPAHSLEKLLWFGSYYWFIPAYIILFMLAPVLNAFTERAEKREFRGVVIGLLIAQALFGWLSADTGHYANGYSALSFIGLYLLAQYIRRHCERLINLEWWKWLLLYLLFTAIPSIIAFVGLYYKDDQYGAIAYSSLFVVAASASLMMMFSRFNFESRTINWLSTSAFAIYLVHQAPVADHIYKTFFNSAYHSMHGGLYILFAVVAALVIGFACILLDRVRIALWNVILRLTNKTQQ